MSYGVPVIATKFVQKSLNLRDMHNTVLCENKLDFENKIKYIQNNKYFYEQLCKNSVKFIENNFTSKKYKKEVKEILN